MKQYKESSSFASPESLGRQFTFDVLQKMDLSINPPFLIYAQFHATYSPVIFFQNMNLDEKIYFSYTMRFLILSSLQTDRPAISKYQGMIKNEASLSRLQKKIFDSSIIRKFQKNSSQQYWANVPEHDTPNTNTLFHSEYEPYYRTRPQFFPLTLEIYKKKR